MNVFTNEPSQLSYKSRSTFSRYVVQGRHSACAIAKKFVEAACKNWGGRGWELSKLFDMALDLLYSRMLTSYLHVLVGSEIPHCIGSRFAAEVELCSHETPRCRSSFFISYQLHGGSFRCGGKAPKYGGRECQFLIYGSALKFPFPRSAYGSWSEIRT